MTDVWTNQPDSSEGFKTDDNGDSWTGSVQNGTWPEWSEGVPPSAGEDVAIDGFVVLASSTGNTTLGDVLVTASVGEWQIGTPSGNHDQSFTVTIDGTLTDNGSVGIDAINGEDGGTGLDVDGELSVGTDGSFSVGNPLSGGNTSVATVDQGVFNSGLIQVWYLCDLIIHTAAGFDGANGEVTGEVNIGSVITGFPGGGGATVFFDSGSINTIADGGTLIMCAGSAINDNSNETANAGLSGLATIDGQLLLDDAAPIATTVGLTIAGKQGDGSTPSMFVDTEAASSGQPGQFGSSVTVGGPLTVNGLLVIGTSTYSSVGEVPDSDVPSLSPIVTAESLSDSSGDIEIVGGNESGSDTTAVASTLDILSAAGMTSAEGLLSVTSLDLMSTEGSGAAVLEFGSGRISEIAAGTDVNLSGPNSFIADAGDVTESSALTGLTVIAGALALTAGASLTTGTDLTIGTGDSSETGILSIDNDNAGSILPNLTVNGDLTLDAAPDGGAELTITSDDDTANSTTVKVTGELLTTGQAAILINGTSDEPGSAVLELGSVGDGQLTNVGIELHGGALLEFDDGGSINTIGSGASLLLDSSSAQISDTGSTTPNSALANLSIIEGALTLENGASLTLGNLTLGGSTIGQINVDSIGIDGGGSSLRIGALALDSGALSVGAAGVVSPTRVTIGSVSAGSGNVKSITVTGLQAALDIESTATGGSYTVQSRAVMDVGGTASGASFSIQSGGRLVLGGAATGGGIAFGTGGGTLVVDSTTMPQEVIIGFGSGDVVDLADETANGRTFANHVLTLTENGAAVASLSLASIGSAPAYLSDQFALTSDGDGGTDIGFSPSQADLTSTSDFNGDGMSDVLWQNDNAQDSGTGQTAIWLMDGVTPAAEAVIGSPPPSWHTVATGDFYGTGDADILWQNDDGQAAIWEMNGTTPIAETVFASPPPSWHMIATGDFNGDGYSDVLWQYEDTASPSDSQNGNVAIWEMNGASAIATAVVAQPGPDWDVIGTGDFNGDGMSDILWQYEDSQNASDPQNGNVAIWEMNGLTPIASAVIAQPGPDWHVVGTGDFNGDGKADILWQYEDSQNASDPQNGNVAIWLMNGTTPTAEAVVAQPGSAWQAIGTGDYDGSGRSDILWQNTNGQGAIWLMNGLTPTTESVFASPPPSWHVIAS